VIRAAALALLLATPAAAELAPDVVAALDICAADGPDLTARTETLLSQGWHHPEGAEVMDAAFAFAPMNLMRLMLIREGQSPAQRIEALQLAATRMLNEMEQDHPSDDFLVSADGAVLRIASPLPDLVACFIATDATAADVATRLGLDPDPRTSPLLTSTRLLQPGTDDVRAYHDRFTSGLFGATDPLAIVTIQPVTITD
jgi:hypothetical protein